MDKERLGGSYRETGDGKPAWKVEREEQLDMYKTRFKKTGAAVIAAVALAVGSYGANSIDKSAEKRFVEQSKEVDVDEMSIKNGANLRIMPTTNGESIVVAKVQGGDGGVTLDCSGETVYYYENESDPNGGWYGISENVLLENEVITSPIGYEVAWINENNVSGVKSDKSGDESI